MSRRGGYRFPGWYVESQTQNSVRLYRITDVYYVGKTRYQDVAILELGELGKSLILDGKLQSSLKDEHVYHEVLVHPAMLTHPNPRSVLVIGGGEGATVREVLKHGTVERVVMVDIDGELVELVKKHLPEFHRGCFEDDRLELVIGDGRKFVERCEDGGFDVVVCDLTDPLEGTPSVLLYTVEFYREVYRVLRDDGVMVSQAESPVHMPKCFGSIAKTISRVFPIAEPYTIYIQSFDTVWGFMFGSKSFNPLELAEEEEAMRIESRGVKLRFYEPKLRRWLFTLPRDYLEVIEKSGVSRDSNPVYEPMVYHSLC